MTLVVAGRPGDEAVASAGLLARHLTRHLGGAAVRVESRSTSTPVDVLNAFSRQTPDGSVVALPPVFAGFLQALGAPDVTYDMRKLAWLGAISSAPMALGASWVTGFRSIDDGRRREMDLGAVGENSPGALMPLLVNGLLRTRFRVALDYRADKDVDAAIDTGAIGGRLAPYSSFVFANTELFQQGKLNFLLQIGAAKKAELGAAPLLSETASAPADRALVDFVSAEASYGRALALPPGASEALVARYRTALAETLADPAFLADARTAHIESSPLAGEALAGLVARELSVSAETVARARRALAEGAR